MAEQYTIYDLGFGKDLIRNATESLDVPFLQEQDPVVETSDAGYSGGLFNSVEGVVQTQSIQSGELPAILKYAKANFSDTTEGWIQGVDSDKVYKWLIGGASQSIDWAVTTASTLTIKGNVTATTGSIGGWTITATTLHSGSVITLDSGNRKVWINSGTFGADGIQLDYNTGNPRFYVGDGVNQFFKFDGTNISWNTPTTSLDTAGLLTTTSALIGGWNVVSGYIYNLQSGTPTAAPSDGVVLASGNEALICYEDTEKRVELGYLSAGVYGLKGYATNGTTVTFELSDTQQKLAGFYFTDTVLRSNTTDASSSIFLDSTNSLIRAGATTGNYLTLDGVNLRLRSSNYVSGFAGAGFTLEPNLLEVGNIACRGLFRTYVLQKDILSVNAGSLIIAPNADVLDADMTALDTSTMTIKGTATFAVGDKLRIKDGTDDEWLIVDSIASAPTYTVTRDALESYAIDSNPAWKKGASVVNYGTTAGDGIAGGLYLTASDTGNPYLSVFTHADDPWNGLTTRVRLGNLNGYLGYVAEIFGFGAGSSSGTNANITIEPTNGIRLRKGTTNSIVLDNSGNITVGEVGAGLSNTYITAGTLSIRNNTTAVFSVDTSGNVLVGQTGAGQSNVYITSGAIQLRNNTTAKITLDTSGNVNLLGNLSVGTAGAFYSGMSSYLNGVGWWMEYNGGTPRLSFGNSAGKYIAFNGTDFVVNGFVLSGLGAFGGDGSDGALTVSSGTTNIDAGSANLVIKNYTTITISAGATLGLTNKATAGTVLILKATGNVTIAGTIEMSGMGANSATTGYFILDGSAHYGGVGTAGSTPLADGNDAAGGTGGAIYSNKAFYVTGDVNRLIKKFLSLACGSGGGIGGIGGYAGGASGGSGGAGGAGGGVVIIECAGAINFTGTVNVNGNTGSNGGNGSGGQAAGGGAGGGGGAGMVLILYNTLTSIAGTINTKGGAGGVGGTGSATGGGYTGGGGGAGAGTYTGIGFSGGTGHPAAAGDAGTNTTTASGAGGGAGGCSGAGGTEVGGNGGTQGATDSNHYLVAQNKYFA